MSSFSDNIKDLIPQPNSVIVDMVDSGRFPFSQNLFFENDPVTLVTEEYKRCHGIFEKRLKDKLKSTSFNSRSAGYNEIMRMYFNVKSSISFKENPHIENLEKLAEDTVREMYGIPDEIELEGYIKPNENDHNLDSSNSNSKEIKNEIPADRMVEIYMAAQKRLILNTLAHGSSIHIWKSSYYIVKDVLEKMDPDLMDLYNDYTSIVSIMLWMYSPDDMERMILTNNAITQGHNKVVWSDDEEEGFDESFDDEMEDEYQKFLEEMKESGEYEEEDPIPIGSSVAINFPVLLHEINKSVFEILSMKSIPSDFNEKELAIYYEISDKYSEEVWHYFMGPTLWVRLLPVMKKAEVDLNELYEIFSNISYERLAEFCAYVVEDQEEAIDKLVDMKEIFGLTDSE